MNQKMYVFSGGMIRCDLNNLVCLATLGDANHHETSSIWAESPISCFLVENDKGLVLFDTGAHPDAMTERWDSENRRKTPVEFDEHSFIVDNLKAIGYTPDDVDYVVLSHLHEDHAGCLEYFTKSKIIVSDTELAQTMKLYAVNKGMAAYIRNDIRHWLDAGLDWNTVSDDETEIDLMDGVKILNFGSGHTFGMLGLLVTLPNSGSFILASDTLNTAKNYGYPICYPGAAYDTRGYMKTAERIHKLAERYNAQVIFGHDGDQYRQIKKGPAAWYD